MSELTSAEVPRPGAGDHIRGDGPEVVLYADLGCPACAAAWAMIATLELRLCFRHFPIASRRPRSPALHAAAEAGALQRADAFWELADSIYTDLGHVDDPHLWSRAEAIGLDLARFDQDRRSTAVSERVRADFDSGIRAGVTSTPTAFAAGERIEGDLAARLGDLRAL